MSKENAAFELTRRKALAAIGTIGAASAGAGLGTTAYFSDEENFEGNTLTAGSLDLKVDWQEHYSDWSADEAEAVNGQVEMTAGDPTNVPDGYVGLPDPEAPRIAIPSESLGAFMDVTSIEAYPDHNDDGIQSAGEGYVACEDGADTPDDLDPTETGLRTRNQDTYDPESGNVKPLVAIDDVKPGDFGEATLSFHICDNPGYVWLQGALDEEMTGENGLTEPEAEDPDEDGSESVELLDTVQTLWWYDTDGDNVFDRGGGREPCVQLVLDASGSMTETDSDTVSRNQEAIDGAKQLAEEIINAGGSVGVTFFSAEGYSTGAQIQQSVSDAGSTDVTTTHGIIDSLPADGGDTAIGEGILTADDDLSNCDPESENPVQVVVTDGGNNAGTDPSTAADDVTGTESNDYTEEIFAIGTGGTSESQLLDFARPSDDVHAEFTDDLSTVISNLAQVILGEEVIYRGTLRDALSELSSGNGIPLDGDRTTSFDELQGDPTADSRDCYPAEETHYIGFAWWLPVDHANEIQTDSVGFDIGFYTEQCRHNSGSGMASETATPTPPENQT